jgi:hypothetical protein
MSLAAEAAEVQNQPHNVDLTDLPGPTWRHS